MKVLLLYPDRQTPSETTERPYMSTDPYAGAVIGLRFDMDHLPKVKAPSCHHAERLGKTFCPVCGRKVGEAMVDDPTIETLLDGIEDQLPPGYVFEREGEDAVANFLGYGCEARGDGACCAEMAPVPDVAEVRETVMRLLDGTGLYSEEAFGLHAYLHWS